MPLLDLKNVDKTWTLFLDRDGVINHEKKLDYIRNWDEFHFYDQALEAIAVCAKKFGWIVVVTNQKGIGKKLMTEADLATIHTELKKEVLKSGGRIDQIYFCSSIENEHYSRKPNPGMAIEAKKEFPEIDFNKSIIVGNKPSDMLFGRNAGMYTVYLTTTHPNQDFPHQDIDLLFQSLMDFAKAL
ncbi:MAG: HAD-IIIA family hydrolase [Chitinophagaceae bacterium]|jgi:histidinol-phosphate phosphatase family protein|nr:HAD-IIIA family hydrolase [Chitinophagaceae bacterium]